MKENEEKSNITRGKRRDVIHIEDACNCDIDILEESVVKLKYGNIGIIGMGKNGATRGNRAGFIWIPENLEVDNLMEQFFKEDLKNLVEKLDRNKDL